MASEDIQEGDEILVDFDKGEIKNNTNKKIYKFIPFPPFMQYIIEKGGLINKVKSEIKK